MDGNVAFVGKIDGIDFARFGQTPGAGIDQFIMWFGFPPLKAGEKVDHMLVALQHDHRVVAASINPAPSGIRPNIDAAARAFTCSPIGAGHGNFPSYPPKRLGGITVGLGSPMRIMVFIAVLLIRLGDKASSLALDLPLFEHESMLVPGPILDRGESEPI